MWWIWLGIIVLILLVGIILILLSTIQIDVFFKKHNKNEMAIIRTKLLYGLIKMEFDLPEIKVEDLQNGLKMKLISYSNLKQMPESDNEDVQVDENKVMKWIDDLRVILKNTHEIRQWLINTMRKVNVTKLEWTTGISLGDAAYTATFTGVLWAIKTTVTGFGSNFVCLKTLPKLQIDPVYTAEPLFSTELSCILRLSFGYAMYAGLMLIVRVLKVKGGIKSWKSILFKA